ncbi:type II toxin-antitoxin system RelE/ParE family toxin [Candidatus Woesearchaeota archaeon]|nr:type II toxin-antitoxin system RelE/ParE family toxin [Candidatus Woesearchaeota archaeon]
MFKIEFSNKAQQFLKKVEDTLTRRLIDKISILCEDPVPHNSVRVIGEERTFRIRVGDYRVLYEINWETKIILIAKIDKRSQAYG